MYGPGFRRNGAAPGSAYWAGMGKELLVLITAGQPGLYSVLALK